MTLPGFEILVNGVPRSFRDSKEAAYDAGLVLKNRWPETAVTLIFFMLSFLTNFDWRN